MTINLILAPLFYALIAGPFVLALAMIVVTVRELVHK